MQLDEFDTLIEQSGALINDLMVQRDIPACFAHAIMLEKNELDSDSHVTATYLEFLEALARVCEDASLESASKEGERNKLECGDLPGHRFAVNRDESYQVPVEER